MSAIRIIITSALITAAFIKGAPALAEPARAVSIVRIADIDLSTEAGQRALDHRLVLAASEVCGTAADVDLAGQNDVRQCRKDVLSDARSRLNRIAAGRLSKRDIVIAAR